MDGVALASRFSLATNRLQYCGPSGADKILYAAITKGAQRAEAGRALLQFEALRPYLDFIGAKHGLEPLHERVVEAYWIGNELLEAFERKDFDALLDALVLQGLPRRIAVRLGASMPSNPIPHHAFHVSFVGVGNVTGHVGTTVANMDLCRPSWGCVTAVHGDRLVLERSPLIAVGNRLVLGPPERVEHAFDPLVLPDVRVGATVALHWGWPALVLTERQREALERYSLASWAAANEALDRPTSSA